MQLGVVGLGRMGGNIARRMMRHGHSCVVYDRNSDAVKDVTRDGAVGSASLDDLAEKLDAPLVFITPCSVLGTCSSLTLTLSAGQIRWSLPVPGSPAHARLPAGLDFQVEVAARRSFKKPSQPVHSFSAQRRWA